MSTVVKMLGNFYRLSDNYLKINKIF